MRSRHERGGGRRVRWGLVLGMLALLACAAEEPAPLRVGTTPDYEPFTFERGDEIVGAELDFARMITQELGRPLQVVRVEWDDLIPALLENRIDVIMSGMSATPERREQVAFADPYMQVGQMALIRAAEFAERREPANVDQPGVRAGVQRGTTGAQFAAAQLQRAEVVRLDSIEAGVQALREGRIDYFVHDAPTIWRIVGGLKSGEDELTGLYRPLTEEHLAWAVRPDDEPLRTQLNALVARWREEALIDITLDAWIPVRKITVEIFDR